jgi:hypothetical protein
VGERQVDHLGDFGGGRDEARSARGERHERRQGVVGRNDVGGLQPTPDRQVRGVHAELLLGLAQGGPQERAVLKVVPAAGQGDLAAMAP